MNPRAWKIRPLRACLVAARGRLASPRVRLAASALLLTGLLAGCGSSTGLGLSASSSDSASASGTGSGGGYANASSMKATGGSDGMAMSMGGSGSSATAGVNAGGTSVNDTKVPEVNGIKPVAFQMLATADWQGMKIEVMKTTPTSYVAYEGTTATGASKYTEVKANDHESFHLMVMLDDAHTGVVIPYASVWATIFAAGGKQVWTGELWPMISAYMGPHYGENVTLPAAGRYTLKLLISPPAVDRHLEYANVWKAKHAVTTTFTWKPGA